MTDGKNGYRCLVCLIECHPSLFATDSPMCFFAAEISRGGGGRREGGRGVRGGWLWWRRHRLSVHQNRLACCRECNANCCMPFCVNSVVNGVLWALLLKQQPSLGHITS